MPSSSAKELLALERRGGGWSRNRNFDLFNQAGPRRARALQLRLEALDRFAEQHRDHGLVLRLRRTRRRFPFELQLTSSAPRARLTVFLAADELPLLRRSPLLAALLERDTTDRA